MDHYVTGIAELTKAHVAQLNFLRAPLYILPSLLHLGIVYAVFQGPNSKKPWLENLVRNGRATLSPSAYSGSFFCVTQWEFNSKAYWRLELKTLLKICQQPSHDFGNKNQIPEVAYEVFRVCRPLRHLPCCLPLLTVLCPLFPWQKRPSFLFLESSASHPVLVYS